MVVGHSDQLPSPPDSETKPKIAVSREARAVEANVSSSTMKGDTPVKESLPEDKSKPQARDQAASVVGVSGKMLSDAR